MIRHARYLSLLITLSLLTSMSAEAGEEWIVWRQNGSTWDVVLDRGVWPTAGDCYEHVPRFAISGATLLIDDRVPGWCCLRVNPDPRSAKGMDALIVAVMCPGFPVDLRKALEELEKSRTDQRH